MTSIFTMGLMIQVNNFEVGGLATGSAWLEETRFFGMVIGQFATPLSFRDPHSAFVLQICRIRSKIDMLGRR